LLATFIVFFIVLIRWKYQISLHSRIFLISSLITILFYYLSNFLEWSGISDIFVDLEDYIAILAPMLWFFFIYSYLQTFSRQELEKSEKKYRKMIQNLDLGFYRVKMDGTYLDHNPMHHKILGFDQFEDLRDLKTIDFWQRPKDRKIYLEELNRKGIIKDYIVPAKKKNGENIVLQINSHLLKDYNGNVLGIEGTFLDITEKFELEKKLKESEQKYRALVENANEIIFSLDNRGNIMYISPVIEQFSGYKLNEVIGKSFTQFILPEDLPGLETSFKRALKGQKEPYEFRIIDKYGSIRHVLTSSNLIIEQGQPVGLIGVMTDISDLKKAEQKLKDSEQKFRHLFEEAPLMIILINKNGRIVDFNYKFISYSDYDKKDILDKDFRELFELFLPKDLKALSEKFREIWKNGSIEPFELQYRNKDSSLIWIKVWASLVKIESEPLIQLIIENIEEVKQAEKLIEQEIIKLKDLDQMKTDLITRASHELKTPLVLIYGATEFILTQYKDQLDEQMIKLIEIIEKGGVRLKKLIDDLIDVSRIESNKLEIKTRKENICSILQNCIEYMEFLAIERDIQINFDFSDPYYINVNKERIEQVIMNLLTNAIKNTPPGGKVSVILKDYINYIDILFKDTGVGFTDDEKKKIFQRFGKIERYGQGMDVDTEGSGLGLYISKEIIKLHKGKIWVESMGRDSGSTFIIRLPKNVSI
ncbi:MAG: PAS domain S-box protein, partial [Promethearchaeota archaeon]